MKLAGVERIKLSFSGLESDVQSLTLYSCEIGRHPSVRRSPHAEATFPFRVPLRVGDIRKRSLVAEDALMHAFGQASGICTHVYGLADVKRFALSYGR